MLGKASPSSSSEGDPVLGDRRLLGEHQEEQETNCSDEHLNYSRAARDTVHCVVEGFGGFSPLRSSGP